MKVYCTSKFEVKQTLDFGRDTPRLLYLGTDLQEAIRLATSVAPPSMGNPKGKYSKLYCALPMTVERTIIRYHNSGDTWASVVEFELEEKN